MEITELLSRNFFFFFFSFLLLELLYLPTSTFGPAEWASHVHPIKICSHMKGQIKKCAAPLPSQANHVWSERQNTLEQ